MAFNGTAHTAKDALRTAIAQCNQVSTILNSNEGALPAAFDIDMFQTTIAAFKTMQNEATGSALDADVNDTIKAKIEAFFTDLDTAIATLKTEKETAYAEPVE